MNKHISKMLCLLLVLGLNWTGLSAIGDTFAYFNDIENSEQNTLAAGTLDFSITNNNIEELLGVELGEDIEFTSALTKIADSLDIQYKARVEKISGSDNFCSALKMETYHSVISYEGTLLSFDTSTTTKLGTWAFEIKLPPAASHIAHGEKCDVDLVFEGWQTNVANYGDGGFFDEERIHASLTSRMIVLNEFLPYPNGSAYGFDFGNDSSDMPQGEWVEIYNNSDYDFDLSGWYIRDESATNKIMITAANTYPATTIIGAKSWLVVYMNKSVLNNTGDTVKLFDNNDKLIDFYTYAGHDYCELEPTPGGENSDTTGGGTCGKVPPNKSYARIPDGIGAWVDPIPTPGGMNVLESEVENACAAPSVAQEEETIIVEEIEKIEEVLDEPIEEIIIEKITDEEENVEVEEISIIETPAVIEEEQPATEEIFPVEIPATIEEEPVVVEESIVIPEPEPEPMIDNNNNDNGDNNGNDE